LRRDTLPALGFSQTEFARRIGVSSRILGELLRERSRLTVGFAQRLGSALDMAPEIWLRMQRAVDFYDLRLKGPNFAKYPQPDKASRAPRRK
jgi:addiction module HigA family antidote